MNESPPPWTVLAATLPPQPSALRVRVWRALKACGAATLREGVYLLPAPAAEPLRTLQHTIGQAGAAAHLLHVVPQDAAQDAAFRARFDRSADYRELLLAVQTARRAMRGASAAETRRRLRTLQQRLQALRNTDFFPGPAAARTAEALAALERAVVGEPQPQAAAIESLARADFQGRTWATRRRPWVDRLATAWLVQRFVDARPRFVWLADPTKAPRSALGYDYDGARFSHVGERVTFEVVAASFGLDADAALRRVGDIVHCIDVGGAPVDEAAGLAAIMRGLQVAHPKDDDALLAAALPVFDALYAAGPDQP
jgi:hypothetical protein